MRYSTAGVRDYIPNGCGGPDLPATIPEVRSFQAWYGLAGHKQSIAMCRRVLTAAGVPSKEIQKVVAVSEMGQLAERTSEERFEIKEPTVLRKLAKAHRAWKAFPSGLHTPPLA
jgi:hypothetical protein